MLELPDMCPKIGPAPVRREPIPIGVLDLDDDRDAFITDRCDE
jgi:hypothetical protein